MQKKNDEDSLNIMKKWEKFEKSHISSHLEEFYAHCFEKQYRKPLFSIRTTFKAINKKQKCCDFNSG